MKRKKKKINDLKRGKDGRTENITQKRTEFKKKHKSKQKSRPKERETKQSLIIRGESEAREGSLQTTENGIKYRTSR